MGSAGLVIPAVPGSRSRRRHDRQTTKNGTAVSWRQTVDRRATRAVPPSPQVTWREIECIIPGPLAVGSAQRCRLVQRVDRAPSLAGSLVLPLVLPLLLPLAVQTQPVPVPLRRVDDGDRAGGVHRALHAC